MRGHNKGLNFYIGIYSIKSFKILFYKQIGQKSFYMYGSVDPRLSKSWSLGVGWGHYGGADFHILIYREKSFKYLSQIIWPEML